MSSAWACGKEERFYSHAPSAGSHCESPAESPAGPLHLTVWVWFPERVLDLQATVQNSNLNRMWRLDIPFKSDNPLTS